MADELDDGLLLDDDLVAASDDGRSDAEGGTAEPTTRPATDKKKQRREKAKAQRRKVRGALTQKSAAFQAQVDATRTVAQQPSDLQADYVAALQRKAFPKLSELELQEMRLLGLGDKASMSAQQPWMTEHGTPRVLVLSGNAQRAADVGRALRALLPRPSSETARPAKRQRTAASDASGPSVAKLFARHFKVSEQVEWLQAQTAPLAVGTPHRVQALLEVQALHVSHLALIVIDFTWVDAKNRTVLDTPETRDALLSLLQEPALRRAMQRDAEPCRIALW